jgi:hypothetical protein
MTGLPASALASRVLQANSAHYVVLVMAVVALLVLQVLASLTTLVGGGAGWGWVGWGRCWCCRSWRHSRPWWVISGLGFRKQKP